MKWGQQMEDSQRAGTKSIVMFSYNIFLFFLCICSVLFILLLKSLFVYNIDV